MPIDPDKAIGAALPEQRFSWSASDVLLYHLAVGAGQRPGDAVSPTALRYTLDDERLSVLPSFGVVAPTFHVTEPPALDLPGCDIDLTSVLHGSQSISLAGPIPAYGKAVVRTRIAEVWDKGKAAVIVQEGEATTPSGAPLWTVRSAIFCRGEGGFGGERGPSTSLPVPERAPDAVATYHTREEQALLYRLCGDRNPLHADPAFAARAGFPRPILHGLCSYGIVLRETVGALLDGDATRVRGFGARFAGIVLPGETIKIEAWHPHPAVEKSPPTVEESPPTVETSPPTVETSLPSVGADSSLIASDASTRTSDLSTVAGDSSTRVLVRASIAGGERDGAPVLADCYLEV